MAFFALIGACFFKLCPTYTRCCSLSLSHQWLMWWSTFLRAPPCPLIQNPKVNFGCCRDALVTKVTGVQVYGWSQSAKVLNQYQQDVVTAQTWWILSEKKVGFGGSLISTPLVLVRSEPWSSVSGLPADKISEIDQPAGLVWLFLSIEKESAVCASHLLLGSAERHGILVQIQAGRTCDGSQGSNMTTQVYVAAIFFYGSGRAVRSSARFFFVVGEGLTFLTHIQSYRHGPTDLFSIGASSSATRFYLTKPRARPRREFALPNFLFDNKAETPDPTFKSFE